MAKISEIEITKLLMDEGAAPGTPAATNVAIYAKADGLMYSKDDAGVETLMSGGTGGTTHGAWTAYTPVLTGSGSNPVLGSSTITGRYKSLDANTYVIYIELVITTGGAWSGGTGNWEFSLPAGLTTVASRRQTMDAHLSTSTRRWPGTAIIGGGATKIAGIAVPDSTGNHTVSATIPVTWATGEYIVIQGVIEVA